MWALGLGGEEGALAVAEHGDPLPTDLEGTAFALRDLGHGAELSLTCLHGAHSAARTLANWLGVTGTVADADKVDALAARDLTSGTLYFSATSAIRRSCQAEVMPPW